MTPTLDAVLEGLRPLRIGIAPQELALHDAVAQALFAAGIEAQHEARLAPRCRIDFLCGTIGIEIKKSRPRTAELARQLARYAACAQIEALIVVCPFRLHLPAHIGAKPVRTLQLYRLWGVTCS